MPKETLFVNEAGVVEIKGHMTNSGTLKIEMRERKTDGKFLSIELGGSDMRDFIDALGRETGYYKDDGSPIWMK